MTDPVALQWKEYLLEVVRPHAGESMFFSGGMDSTTLLAAQLELDARPELYTVKLAGYPESSDLVSARATAKREGLNLVVVEIPTTLLDLYLDVKLMIKLLGSTRKAAIQCSHPIHYMARAMASAGHTRAMLGTCHIALDGKRVALVLAKEGEERARELRRERYGDRWRDGHPTWCMHKIAQVYGIVTSEPYSDEPLKTYALSLDMAELNKPVEKGIAVRAFPSYFKRNKPRRATPLQIGSGIRELHDRLLLNSALDKRDAKSVVKVYNDIQKEINEPALF